MGEETDAAVMVAVYPWDVTISTTRPNDSAMNVIGGVITSTLLTLQVIPTVYETLADIRDWLGARLAKRRGREAHLPYPESRIPIPD